MTTTATTSWKTTLLRPTPLIGGPQSAFARLFPEKYRQQEELKKQRSKSSDNHCLNNDRIIIEHRTNDDDNDNNQKLRRSGRIRFHSNVNDSFQNLTKSEPHLNQIHLSSDYSKYYMNYDTNYTDDITYTQTIGIRYLRPPTPPSPEPLVIREIQTTLPDEPSSLIISTTPPIPPRTPSPLIVREQPPTPPAYQPTEIITKNLPLPSSGPRHVTIKHISPFPAKPRPVIIEKWLPYKATIERRVLYQRTEQIQPIQHNLILQYEQPRVKIKQEIQNFGCFRVDPKIYQAQHGSSLRRTDSIRKVLENIGCNADLITSTEYNTCYYSTMNQTNNSSHYDYPRQTTTTEHHYDVPRKYDEETEVFSTV
ncbi:unnamed protein product [Rotaria sp. Silwood1]|nr:unnamed protein product [Rotaria sp. Silwood1]CAF1585229.1 unnamed protein product [Rotaria sp. Silwood1]CAF3678957.1 unnamed protein product [Rotaria sp. Silwood1]CAF4593051.1 unnamed protein product [Rotaria sp. Silwood1]